MARHAVPPCCSGILMRCNEHIPARTVQAEWSFPCLAWHWPQGWGRAQCPPCLTRANLASLRIQPFCLSDLSSSLVRFTAYRGKQSGGSLACHGFVAKQARPDYIQQSGVISLLQDWFLQTIPRVPWQAERSYPLLAMALALRWGWAAVSPGPNKGAISMMPIRPFCLCCLQSPALFRRKARKQARPAQQSGGFPCCGLWCLRGEG